MPGACCARGAPLWAQLLREPDNVIAVAPLNFLNPGGGQFVKLFLEEAMIAGRIGRVARADEVSQPENEKQIAIHAALEPVAEIITESLLFIDPRQLALLAERSGLGKLNTAIHHAFEQGPPGRACRLFREHIEQLQLELAGNL